MKWIGPGCAVPKSITWMTFGWFNWLSSRASRKNRLTARSSACDAARIVLTATGRPSVICVAR